MAASMGFVMAKKGGAPDGSRIELTLTGPVSRTIRVAVDGRAAVVPDFSGQPPTATNSKNLIEQEKFSQKI
jgi:hypothetical protein